MREYQTGMREERVLSKVVCNGCGREIPLRGADYFHAEKTWGYFSEQDGRQDAFDLCEECYRKMTEGFRIKIEEKADFGVHRRDGRFFVWRKDLSAAEESFRMDGDSL